MYIGGIRVITDGIPLAIPSNGVVNEGPGTGLVWYKANIGSGGDEIPASMQAQLPGYIPTALSAVPEPTTLALMAVGVLGIAWRGRSRFDAATRTSTNP